MTRIGNKSKKTRFSHFLFLLMVGLLSVGPYRSAALEENEIDLGGPVPATRDDSLIENEPVHQEQAQVAPSEEITRYPLLHFPRLNKMLTYTLRKVQEGAGEESDSTLKRQSEKSFFGFDICTYDYGAEPGF